MPSSCSMFSDAQKAVQRTTTTDDKRLQNTLKRVGVNTIPGIEEVNIFSGDSVIHFTNPKGAQRRRALRNSAALQRRRRTARTQRPHLRDSRIAAARARCCATWGMRI